MASWLEKLFREHGVFKLPRSASRLPACRIRPYQEADLEACRRIYQLNEGGNFSGGHEAFEQSLQKGKSLYFVCEKDGGIRAMGAMRIYYIKNDEVAEFSFGMVHPDHHHGGFGTAIVLARLAVLPPPRCEWQVRMRSVADGFHRKFGFHPHEVTRDSNGNRMVHLQLYLSQRETDRIRRTLQAAHIEVESAGCQIPVFLPAAPTPEHTSDEASGSPAPEVGH